MRSISPAQIRSCPELTGLVTYDGELAAAAAELGIAVLTPA